MGCAGSSKEEVKNKKEPNIPKNSNSSDYNEKQNQNNIETGQSQNMNNKNMNMNNEKGRGQNNNQQTSTHKANKNNNSTQDLDTDNFNEDDYPIFQSNWSQTNIQNLRFVSIGMPYKGLVFYDKLFITIDHNKKRAKLIKIEKEEKGKSKKKHLIQKIYNDRSSFEDFYSDLEALSNDLTIINLEDLYSKGPSTDCFIVFQNLNGEYELDTYLFDKETNNCIDDYGFGNIGSDGGSSKPDPYPTTPEEIVEKYNEKISELIDYKKLDLKKLAKDKNTDKDLNTADFYDSDYPEFQIFWYKNIFQNFRLITAKKEEDGTVLFHKIFITIDFFQNKTKFAKIEINSSEGDIKRHLTQKIYKEKCTLKKFQKDIEAYDKDFKILDNDIFSKPPSTDIFIVAQNIRGNIKRNLYIYDKETYKCFEESLEGPDDDYFTSDSTMEKMPITLAEEFKDKILGLEEDLDEEPDEGDGCGVDVEDEDEEEA